MTALVTSSSSFCLVIVRPEIDVELISKTVIQDNLILGLGISRTALCYERNKTVTAYYS